MEEITFCYLWYSTP